MDSNEKIISSYLEWISSREFPCIGAKAAARREQVRCLVVDHMACPAHDPRILQFIYTFIDGYRESVKSFHSAAVIFRLPIAMDELSYDKLLWERLRALAKLDRVKYAHDKRVDADPTSPRFSFSLKEEALFIIGIHPASKRKSRQFSYPAMVFNPHAEFEKLRKANRYQSMKEVVRKRDIAYSGTVNPLLKDFGEASEVFQFSGVQHPPEWKCPLAEDYDENESHSTP